MEYYFSGYDIACACLALLPIILISATIAVGLLFLFHPVSATTISFNPSNSGYITRESDNSTLDSLRNGAGTSVDSSYAGSYVRIRSGTTTNTWMRIVRGVLIFDTSTLPDNAVIDSATVSLFRNDYKTDLGEQYVVLSKFNIDGTITADDYDNIDFIPESDTKNIGSMISAQYYNFTLNNEGKQNISLTGSTGIALRIQADMTGTPPTWQSGNKYTWWAANNSHALGNFPILEINYHIPTPPVADFFNR